MLPATECEPVTLEVSVPRFVTDAVPVQKSNGVAKVLARFTVPPVAFVSEFEPPLENPNNNRSSPAIVNVPWFTHDFPPTSARKPPPDGVFTVLAPCVVNTPEPVNALLLT